MCLINRVSADPPVRRDVALWSVQICPFLSRPTARRDPRVRANTDAEGVMREQRGVALARNPGVSMIYVTDSCDPCAEAPGLLLLGPPQKVTYWREGRAATAAEVWAAVESGLPALQDVAEREGDDAVIALGRHFARATPWLPPRPMAAE